MTGLDVDEVRRLIASWEESGVIRRYQAVLDLGRATVLVGAETVTALIDVALTPARGVVFDDVATSIARFKEVRSVYLVSGAQDLRCAVSRRAVLYPSGRYL
jgi:DNA-binding Lrp family transcriptional regulator